MNSRYAIYLLFSGGALIFFRTKLAEQMYTHYQPVLPKRFSQVAATRLMSVFIGAFGALLTLWGLVSLQYGQEYIDQFGTNTTISVFVLVSGIAYLIWSIPGYYRWKKTKKRVELALFSTKFAIGILTIIGLIVGYALGRI